MTALTTTLPVYDGPASQPRPLTTRLTTGDRTFLRGALGSGLLVLGVMVGVGVFLLTQATEALSRTGVLDFVTTSAWQPDRNEFGIAAVMVGTVMIALVAVSAAVPVAMGTALFIVEVAPRRLRSTFVAMVDLMAAVPSVVYGMWGLYYFQGHAIGVARWISTWLSFVPVFRVDGANEGGALASETVYTASAFVAGIVVALMVMPIACSVMREVFSQVPTGEREGALALGATRWGMVRTVSLPFARGGIIGGTMLGLGRALGETIAVLLIISPRFDISFNVFEAGSNSVSSLIALRYSEASGFGLSALMAAGLALFATTLVVNFSASYFVARSRSGASSEA